MFGGMAAQQRKLLLVIVVLGVAAAAALGVTLLRADTPLRADAPPRGDVAVPVVLIHGYGGSAASVAALEARLEAAGHEVVSVNLPASGTGDIDVSAERVADAVVATRAPVVDLVGFSAGGVVARAALDDLPAGRSVRTVVTLGSPHHGARVAGMAVSADPRACTGACAQLVPDSAFLRDLNEPDETPEGTAFVAIWTAFDEVVTPPESATLDGATNVRLQDVCPGSRAGHGDLKTDPAAAGLVLRALDGRTARVAAPGCRALQEVAG